MPEYTAFAGGQSNHCKVVAKLTVYGPITLFSALGCDCRTGVDCPLYFIADKGAVALPKLVTPKDIFLFVPALCDDASNSVPLSDEVLKLDKRVAKSVVISVGSCTTVAIDVVLKPMTSGK